MSNRSQKNDRPAPITRAQKRAAKRARQADYRQSAAGRRRTAARLAGYRDRNARLAQLPADEQALYA